MFCGNCGTELPDNANYCSKCGKSQNADVAYQEEAKWETCQIDRVSLTNTITGAMGWGGDKICFQAEAIGLDGFYIAEKSQIFTESGFDNSRKKETSILEALVAILVKDSWQPVETKGEQWYSYRFKRLVKVK